MKTRSSGNLLQALERVSRHVPLPFIAPIPYPKTTTLFTFQDSIPYTITLPVNNQPDRPGWYQVEPTSKREGFIARNAWPMEYLEYLRGLPRFMIITLYPVENDGIVVIPFNPADAAQRGWQRSEPKVMHLTRSTASANTPFTVAYARDMAGTLLYDTVSVDRNGSRIQGLLLEEVTKGDPFDSKTLPSNYQLAYSLVSQRIESQRVLTDADKLKNQLHFVGADLVGYVKSDAGYSVTYSYEGATFTVRIGEDMRCYSAGICLAGTEQNYDLATVVQVMQEARRRKRPDLDRSLHL